MAQKTYNGLGAATTSFDDLETDLDAVPSPMAAEASAKRKPAKKRVAKLADDRKWRFINVPYREKDEAKELGARWNPDASLWYIPKGVARKHFRWPDVEISAVLQAKLDAVDQAVRAAAIPKLPKKTYRAKDPSAARAAAKMVRDMNLRFDFVLGAD